jgi:hypothetical protein
MPHAPALRAAARRGVGRPRRNARQHGRQHVRGQHALPLRRPGNQCEPLEVGTVGPRDRHRATPAHGAAARSGASRSSTKPAPLSAFRDSRSPSSNGRRPDTPRASPRSTADWHLRHRMRIVRAMKTLTRRAIRSACTGAIMLSVAPWLGAQSPTSQPPAPGPGAAGPAATAPAAPAPISSEQASYLFGLTFGEQLHSIGIGSDVTSEGISRGFKEGLQGKEGLARRAAADPGVRA